MESCFQILRSFKDDAFSLVLSMPDEQFPLLYGLYKGLRLPSNMSTFIDKALSQTGVLEDFLASNLSWYLVSPRVRNALQAGLVTGVEFVDIGLGAVNQSIEGYTLMHPRNCLDLIDESRSDIVWSDVSGNRMVERWYKLVLDPRKIEAVGAFPDFIALKHFPFFAVGSEKMVDILAAGQFSGYSVKELTLQ